MLSGLIISLVMMMAVGMTAAAGEDKTSSQEYLDSLNVGVATLLAPDTNEEEGSEKTEDGKEEEAVPGDLMADNSASRVQVTEETVRESIKTAAAGYWKEKMAGQS